MEYCGAWHTWPKCTWWNLYIVVSSWTLRYYESNLTEVRNCIWRTITCNFHNPWMNWIFIVLQKSQLQENKWFFKVISCNRNLHIIKPTSKSAVYIIRSALGHCNIVFSLELHVMCEVLLQFYYTYTGFLAFGLYFWINIRWRRVNCLSSV